MLRHAESDGNVNKKVFENTPDWQIGLTDKGNVQSMRAPR